MTLSPVRLAARSCPCRTKTAVNRGSSVFPKNNPSSFLTGTTHALLTHQPVGACEINGETIAHELERRRNATGSLVQNFRAGFVPLELPNRMSWYSATTTRVSGRLRVGKPEPLATGVRRHRARIVNPDVACELGHEGFSYCVSSLSTRCRTDCLFTLSPSYFFELPQPR